MHVFKTELQKTQDVHKYEEESPAIYTRTQRKQMNPHTLHRAYQF